jgi:hypothetical protein
LDSLTTESPLIPRGLSAVLCGFGDGGFRGRDGERIKLGHARLDGC